MSELTIEQATQRHIELVYLAKHYEEMSKHYLRESILTEQAIRQAQAQAAPEQPVVEEVRSEVISAEEV